MRPSPPISHSTATLLPSPPLFQPCRSTVLLLETTARRQAKAERSLSVLCPGDAPLRRLGQRRRGDAARRFDRHHRVENLALHRAATRRRRHRRGIDFRRHVSPGDYLSAHGEYGAVAATRTGDEHLDVERSKEEVVRHLVGGDTRNQPTADPGG